MPTMCTELPNEVHKLNSGSSTRVEKMNTLPR